MQTDVASGFILSQSVGYYCWNTCRNIAGIMQNTERTLMRIFNLFVQTQSVLSAFLVGPTLGFFGYCRRKYFEVFVLFLSLTYVANLYRYRLVFQLFDCSFFDIKSPSIFSKTFVPAENQQEALRLKKCCKKAEKSQRGETLVPALYCKDTILV